MNVTSLRDRHPIGSKVQVLTGGQPMTVLTRVTGSSFAYCVWADAGGEVRCADFHDDDLIPTRAEV